MRAAGPWARREASWFGRHGLLEEHTVREMLAWDHGAPREAWSGFSLDASVRIAAHDRAGLERLLRGHPPQVGRARPPFALSRIEWQRSSEEYDFTPEQLREGVRGK